MHLVYVHPKRIPISLPKIYLTVNLLAVVIWSVYLLITMSLSYDLELQVTNSHYLAFFALDLFQHFQFLQK